MIKLSLLFIIVVWQCACASNSRHVEDFTYYAIEKFHNQTVEKIMEILNIPQIPERYFTGSENFFKNLNRKPVVGFSWNNCGADSDPVQLKSLSLPDPLHLPGNVTISFDVVSSVDLTSPIELDVTIKKKVAFIWIQIPCINQQGSCTYSDLCTLLPTQCPAEFIKYKIPCNCPAAQGEYVFPEGQISLPALPLPSWATHGDYKIEATAKANGKRLFCYDLSLSLD